MFYEQILSGKFSPPHCHLVISVLDIGQAKVALGYENGEFNVGAAFGVGDSLPVD